MAGFGADGLPDGGRLKEEIDGSQSRATCGRVRGCARARGSEPLDAGLVREAADALSTKPLLLELSEDGRRTRTARCRNDPRRSAGEEGPTRCAATADGGGGPGYVQAGGEQGRARKVGSTQPADESVRGGVATIAWVDRRLPIAPQRAARADFAARLAARARVALRRRVGAPATGRDQRRDGTQRSRRERERPVRAAGELPRSV